MLDDNGTSLTSNSMLKWLQDAQVRWHYISPEKPTDNAIIESFNGKFRAEFLNTHWFISLGDAQPKME